LQVSRIALLFKTHLRFPYVQNGEMGFTDYYDIPQFEFQIRPKF